VRCANAPATGVSHDHAANFHEAVSEERADPAAHRHWREVLCLCEENSEPTGEGSLDGVYVAERVRHGVLPVLHNPRVSRGQTLQSHPEGPIPR